MIENQTEPTRVQCTLNDTGDKANNRGYRPIRHAAMMTTNSEVEWPNMAKWSEKDQRPIQEREKVHLAPVHVEREQGESDSETNPLPAHSHDFSWSLMQTAQSLQNGRKVCEIHHEFR